MRILVIAPEQLPVPPIKGGSVETCVYNIFRRMAGKAQVTILSRAHRQLPHESTLAAGTGKIVRINQARRFPYLTDALRKVRGKHFDLIQIENRPSFVPHVAKAFPRTPIVLSLHSLTFISLLPREQADSVLNRVRAVVSVSSFVTQTMKRRFPIHRRKFFTNKTGVDTDVFRPQADSQKQKLRVKRGVPGSCNILFVGRMVHGKGLHTLVRSVAILKQRYPNIRLVAVGSSWPGVQRQTSYLRKVRSLSKQLKVPIRFTGYLPPCKMADAYHLGDVVVCPSLLHEGLPLVSLEAMSSGVPIVASDRGGNREAIVHGRSGLLVKDYANPAAYARAIDRILASPAASRIMALGGRNRVLTVFSWDRTVSGLLRIYRHIAGSEAV
ncbi:glycosyltransferase family 4 protein [Brevibacillus sp. B_LB10_24]|uniref:glycosyltransferase family 4 protein n=1 Tax=Brevibacillus sp. B_LB10_24 TaxID=3380645 RepID=UPI0038B8CEFF